MALERLPRLGDVHHQAAMSADRGGALDGESDNDWGGGLRLEVDIASWDVWGAVVEKREKVDLLGGL